MLEYIAGEWPSMSTNADDYCKINSEKMATNSSAKIFKFSKNAPLHSIEKQELWSKADEYFTIHSGTSKKR